SLYTCLPPAFPNPPPFQPFSIWEADPSLDNSKVLQNIQAASLSRLQPPETPSNVTAAEAVAIQLAEAQVEPAKPGTWWFWGAADNVRLPAANAVKLAEKLAE